jgi:hypothetical protein
LSFVGVELRRVGQAFVHQQVGDLLELRLVGEVQDVVAAIVQVVAGAADGAQGRLAGDGAGQGHGLLRGAGGGVGHGRALFLAILAKPRSGGRAAST